MRSKQSSMHFYSGYSLRNESAYFTPWLKEGMYTVSGFSYGAINAVNHVLGSGERTDTLQLFSPAYFCNRSEGFKRLQMKGYRRDSAAYLTHFVENCFAPYPVQAIEVCDDGAEALETLLTYAWPVAVLRTLRERGVRVEVYLGGKDHVIDADAAWEYFKPHATVFYIKDANHFLQGV